MKKSTIDFLKSVVRFLRGKKTYICSAIVAFIVFFKANGWIDEAMANSLMALFAALGVASLRSAIE